MSAIDGGPDESFLDLHMYMTSALRKSDVKAVGLQMALELMHDKHNKDVITGLKVRRYLLLYFSQKQLPESIARAICDN